MPPSVLALSIDCDGCTLSRLRQVLGYWAGEGPTDWGPGLGLPVASSMFAYSRNPAAPPQAAYLDGDRDGLLDAWKRGWIDTIHGLGDFTTGSPCTRDLAARAFDALAADGVRIRAWTNHGGPENVQNLLRANALGDVPGSPCHLADLAEAYGIRYLWPSELTPVVGQGRPCTPDEYYGSHADAPRWKRALAALVDPVSTALVRRLGFEPYAGNALVEPRALRDGRRMHVFRRWGRWRHDTISVLPDLLVPAVLDRLEQAGGFLVLYLHIGPSADETPERLAAGVKALDEVARRHREGRIRVMRTVDALDLAAKGP